MKPPAPKVILITGCSSGIGQASAERLARRGHVVYATARRPESVEALRQWAAATGDNARTGHLDVTEPQTSRDAVARVVAECGRIDVLINNAGYGQAGAVEDVALEQWWRQFEVNLFGTIALTQMVLPAMRAARSGRIINVSSVVAHVTVPFMGAYTASKHALDAVSNALRMEVRRWGVHVVLIEPGPIATDFRRNVLAHADPDTTARHSAYAEAYAVLAGTPTTAHQRATGSADDVARAIQRAVEARCPRTRYPVTSIARWVPRVACVLSDRVIDAVTLRAYRLRRFSREVKRSK
ncbi:MAG: SDR family NAD(P)-dependent oxidoreductase [Phycisphaerales bacterium]|nr:MAG: SDR family NAD(P)-dependent oxidoreductase [Phycisphaerales bacterium]